MARYSWRVAAVTAAGALLRLGFLDHQWLWRDEAFTALALRQPVARMLDIVRADSAPPLAYVLDHLVAPVWAGPGGLRLVSALAGVALIPIGAALGRRIAGDAGGVAAALVCALAPALVLSSRDARMYALAGTLVLLATLLLWRAVERPSVSRWGLYALAVAAAAYTDYFTLLAPAAQLVAIALVLRPRRRVLFAAAAAAAAGCVALLPWILVARGQLSHAGDAFWVPPLSGWSIGGEAVQLLAGPPLEGWVGANTLLRSAQGVAAAAGIGMAAVLLVRRRQLTPEGRRAAGFLAVCGGGAILLLLLLSLWRPVFDGRFASAVWTPLFPVLGAGLALARARPVLATAFAAATAAATLSLAFVETHPDTPAAAVTLAAQVSGSDLVDAYPTEYELLLYYGNGAVAAHMHVLQPRVAWYWGTAAYPPGAIVSAPPSPVTANAGTIWYVAEPNDPPPVLLPAGYTRRSQRCWSGVCVSAYRR